MAEREPYYLKKLREQFGLKQKANAHYSLRAFARDLKIQAPTLSQILKGKRALPSKVALATAERLNLSPLERTRFLESFSKTLELEDSSSASEICLKEEAHYKVIAEWEHYAILSLIKTKGFKSQVEWIARRLSISPIRAQSCLENLMEAGLIRLDGKKIERVFGRVFTTKNVLSQALQESHQENLKLAALKISLPIEQRDFQSFNLVMDPEQIPQVRLALEKFKKDLANISSKSQASEVYTMATQFYPVSKIGERK